MKLTEHEQRTLEELRKFSVAKSGTALGYVMRDVIAIIDRLTQPEPPEAEDGEIPIQALNLMWNLLDKAGYQGLAENILRKLRAKPVAGPVEHWLDGKPMTTVELARALKSAPPIPPESKPTDEVEIDTWLAYVNHPNRIHTTMWLGEQLEAAQQIISRLRAGAQVVGRERLLSEMDGDLLNAAQRAIGELSLKYPIGKTPHREIAQLVLSLVPTPEPVSAEKLAIDRAKLADWFKHYLLGPFKDNNTYWGKWEETATALISALPGLARTGVSPTVEAMYCLCDRGITPDENNICPYCKNRSCKWG